jgi:cobalt-zinc-cadmium efflux system outer membrane protein
VEEAIQTRPDALAAERAAAAAEARVQFSRLGWFRFLGIGDATTGTITDHAFGPAFRMTVPIFNRNQGGIARAQAEFEQLKRRQISVHNQIVLDVRQNYARLLQAHSEMEFLRKKTRPEVEDAIRRAEIAYKEGNVTYLIVLEMNRMLIDTYAREAALAADLRRAWAEVERSVGKKLR